jgi:hypothetical protein
VFQQRSAQLSDFIFVVYSRHPVENLMTLLEDLSSFALIVAARVTLSLRALPIL